MFGKNNQDMRKKQMGQKTKIFTLRKLRVGLVSAMIGSCFLFGNHLVSANQVEGSEAALTTEVTEPVDKVSEDVATETLADTPVVTSENTPEVETSLEVTEEETPTEAVTETAPEAIAEPTTETSAEPVSLEDAVPATDATAKQEIGNDPSLVIDKITQDGTFGEKALEHVEYLSENIGNRVVGTEKELQARDYLVDQFKKIGYDVQVEEFTFERRGQTYTSHNVSVVKPGALKKEVIVGAHYDSVSSGGSLGADDNASGVGILLEMAERLFDQFTDYTIRFIGFGAEEVGLQGSRYHVANMTPEHIENTLAMINLDSLISGDFKYVYSGLEGKHWVRDQAYDIAKELDIDDLQTNPGLNKDYPYGETGDWSDHAPFNGIGIPVIYFEATNWNIGDKDGYSQTEKFGPIFHTGMDNLNFLNENFPGRVRSHLYTFSATLYNLLTNITNPDVKTELITETLPFETIYIIDDTLGTNEEVLVTEGVEGVKTIKIIDGKIVKEEITSPATNRVVKRRSSPLIVKEDPIKVDVTKKEIKPGKVAASGVNKLPETGVEQSSHVWALVGLVTGLGFLASEKLKPKKAKK